MDEKFKMYDEVTGAATQWLVCYITEHDTDAVITQVDWRDEEDLCILSILSWMPLIISKNIYYKGNIFQYWILKHIKKFKFLKWYKFDTEATEIRLHDFERELMLSLNKHPSILAEIYNEYYKR